MENINIAVEKREGTGKGVARRLRAAGKVPAVLYGHGDAVSIALDSRTMLKVLRTHGGGNAILNLKIDGEKDQLAMVKEVQASSLKHSLIHMDLVRISMDRKVEVAVPVELINDEHIKKEAGIIQHNLNEITIECFPGGIPESIQVDLSGYKLGDSITVADLKLDESITVIDDPEEVIAAILAPRAAEETPAEDAPVETQEIKKKKEEEK